MANGSFFLYKKSLEFYVFFLTAFKIVKPIQSFLVFLASLYMTIDLEHAS